LSTSVVREDATRGLIAPSNGCIYSLCTACAKAGDDMEKLIK
jgi:hypothetical protein